LQTAADDFLRRPQNLQFHQSREHVRYWAPFEDVKQCPLAGRYRVHSGQHMHNVSSSHSGPQGTSGPGQIDFEHYRGFFFGRAEALSQRPSSSLQSNVLPTMVGPPKADHPCVTEKLIWESRAAQNLPK